MLIQVLKRTSLVSIILAWFAYSAAAAVADKPKNKARRNDSRTQGKAKSENSKSKQSDQSEIVHRPKKRVWFYARMSNTFDSNIDHSETNISSFGVVPSLGVHFQNTVENPAFEMEYETAFHSYSNTSRWNRTSHKLRANFERRLLHWLSWETTSEVTVRGSSEDRELNNQFVLGQELELRVNRNRRYKVFGAYRLKRYPTPESGRNSISPYVGASFEQRFGSRRGLEMSYRYENNRSWSSRNRYIRWTYGAEFKTPFWDHHNLLIIEAKYRPQLYSRIIEVEDRNGREHDEIRRDSRWIFGAAWERPLKEKLAMGLGYRFETRSSNDPSKNFNAHLVGVRFTYQWWR